MDKRIKAGGDLLTRAIYKAERYKDVETGKEGEEGIDYGLIILPPIDGSDNPEMNGYPADYLEYAQQRLKKYKQEHGELPQWDYGKGKDAERGAAREPACLSHLAGEEAAEEIDRRSEETQRQADETKRAIRGTL